MSAHDEYEPLVFSYQKIRRFKQSESSYPPLHQFMSQKILIFRCIGSCSSISSSSSIRVYFVRVQNRSIVDSFVGNFTKYKVFVLFRWQADSIGHWIIINWFEA